MVFLGQLIKLIRFCPRRVLRRCLQCLLFATAIAYARLGFQDSYAASPTAEEYAVKAAYLYNFAKFIEWPAQTFATVDSPLNLCIVGKDPFGDALESVTDKAARQRPFVIRRLAGGSEDIDSCHILFLSDSETTRLAHVLAKLGNAAVLTVSDMPGFAQAGGMIGLVNVGQRIRFEINMLSVQRANLKISSQLLRLATVIGDSGGNLH